MEQTELKALEREYRRQQTTDGQKGQRVLENFVSRLNSKTGLNMLAGTLKPVRNYRTGEITNYFVER